MFSQALRPEIQIELSHRHISYSTLEEANENSL